MYWGRRHRRNLWVVMMMAMDRVRYGEVGWAFSIDSLDGRVCACQHCAGAMLIFAVWVGPFPTSPALGAIVRGGGRRPIVNYNLRLAQPLLTGLPGQTRMKLKYLEVIAFVSSAGGVSERATKRQGCAHA